MKIFQFKLSTDQRKSLDIEFILKIYKIEYNVQVHLGQLNIAAKNGQLLFLIGLKSFENIDKMAVELLQECVEIFKN